MLYRRLLLVLLEAISIRSAIASPVAGDRLPELAKRDVPDTHALHERQIPHWSRTWQKKARVEKTALLPVRIGLRQTNLQEGHDLLMKMSSDPASSHFGRRMSALEVIDFFAPPKEAVEATRDWLVAGGINVTRISQSTNKQVGTGLFVFPRHALQSSHYIRSGSSLTPRRPKSKTSSTRTITGGSMGRPGHPTSQQKTTTSRPKSRSTSTTSRPASGSSPTRAWTASANVEPRPPPMTRSYGAARSRPRTPASS